MTKHEEQEPVEVVMPDEPQAFAAWMRNEGEMIESAARYYGPAPSLTTAGLKDARARAAYKSVRAEDEMAAQVYEMQRVAAYQDSIERGCGGPERRGERLVALMKCASQARAVLASYDALLAALVEEGQVPSVGER